MYFPYLRGKQYELLALKDFSQMSPNNAKIIPVRVGYLLISIRVILICCFHMQKTIILDILW